MRSPYTCLYREIWDDQKFYAMSELGKLVYLFILTTPAGNGLGCFRVGTAAMAEDMRLPPKRFREGFREGLAQGLFEHDEKHRVIWIPKYFLRNPPANPNGIVAMSKEFVKVPDCPLKAKCYQAVEQFVQTKTEGFVERFGERFEKPLSEPPGNDLPVSSSQFPVSSSQSPATQSPDHACAGDEQSKTTPFDKFWASYPRKVGIGAAEKAWEKAVKGKRWPGFSAVLAALDRSKASEQWTKDNGQFVPHPSTWLSQGRWDDEERVKGQVYIDMIEEIREEEANGQGTNHQSDRRSQ